MKLIPISQGKHAIIDDDLFELLSRKKWSCGGGRAMRVIQKHKKKHTCQMHRLIWLLKNGPIADSFEIDHIDRDKLNNQIKNLRLATRQQNNMNRSKVSKNNLFKGIEWSNGRWVARIGCDTGKTKREYLGCFVSAKDAAMAYDVAAKRLYGEFACLNFQK